MSGGNDYKSSGEWVRNAYLKPAGISIKEAAQRLGVARQTFSAFINGRIAATPKLAARLEQVFGVDAQMLLAGQNAKPFAADQDKEILQRYVPSYLSIRAGDLVRWADTVEARTSLAVLLRILIHSTARNLLQADFPGGDEAERPGWDGWLEAGEGTPWIPKGTSGWEFGVGANYRQKAERDFSKRTAKTAADVRQNVTYVFVTLRRWPTKNAWVTEKQQARQWRDIRVYDASDLEQWLEQSLPGQLWLAERWQRSTKGVRTLQQCSHAWSAVTHPAMSDRFFDERIAACCTDFQRWLQEGKTEVPFVIETENRELGLAFLACLVQKVAKTSDQDRLMVFDAPDALTRLGGGQADFIAVVYSQETIQSWQLLRHPVLGIWIQPSDGMHPVDVVLKDWTGAELRMGLSAMGITSEQVPLLIRQAGGSLPVLRRWLSVVPAVRMPPWANTDVPPEVVFSIALLGQWERQVDRDLLVQISGVEDDSKLARYWHQLLIVEEAPVWESLDRRGAVAKREMLWWAAPKVLAEDVYRFLKVAEQILLEHRPLKLKWQDYDGIHHLTGTRRYSVVVRENLTESLVWLAVCGDVLLKGLEPTAMQCRVDAVIGRILAGASEDDWGGGGISMPLCAEAAPEVFLDWIETGLQRRLTVGALGRNVRHALVEALACLAWCSSYFPRAVYALAALAENHWDGKAYEALTVIFRVEQSQTWASAERRLQVLDELRKRWPEGEWRLCRQVFSLNADDRGNKSPVFRRKEERDSNDDSYKAALTERAVSRGAEETQALCDLLERLRLMTRKSQERVFRQLQSWRSVKKSEAECALMQKTLQRRILYRDDLPRRCKAIGKAVYEVVRSDDWWKTHLWLFESYRKRTEAEFAEGLTLSSGDQRLLDREFEQLQAVRDCWRNKGLDGVAMLIQRAESPEWVGATLAKCSLTAESLTEVVRRVHQTPQGQEAIRVMWATLPTVRQVKLLEVLRSQSGDVWPEVLRWMPPCPVLWQILDKDAEVTEWFWKRADLTSIRPTELLVRIPLLVQFGRAREGFQQLAPCLEVVSDRNLLLLLQHLVYEPQLFGRPWVDDAIKRAVRRVDQSPLVAVDDKVRLEWRHLVALEEFDPDPYDIPYLSRRIEECPRLLWTIMKFLDKADDEDALSGKNWLQLERARSFFRTFRRTPGCDAPKVERVARLSAWVQDFLALASTKQQRRQAAQVVGQVLGRSAPDADGLWPAVWVADVVTSLKSEVIAQAMAEDRFHYWRWTGIPSAEALVRCREWKDRCSVTHPDVAAAVLGLLEKLLEGQKQQDEDNRRLERRGETPIVYCR